MNTPPLIRPNSTAEFVYHLCFILLVGIGVILGAVSVLQNSQEPPAIIPADCEIVGDHVVCPLDR